jgi:hypothetical protein
MSGTLYSDSFLNYLFAGIPIFNALRFIININATKLSEIIAPTRNVALNAIAFGTEDVTPSGDCNSEVNSAMNIPMKIVINMLETLQKV